MIHSFTDVQSFFLRVLHVVASCPQSGVDLFTFLILLVQLTTGWCPISTPSVSSFILPLHMHFLSIVRKVVSFPDTKEPGKAFRHARMDVPEYPR